MQGSKDNQEDEEEKEHFIIQIRKQLIFFNKIVVQRLEVPHPKPFPLTTKKSKLMPSCAYVRMCDAYSIMKNMEKRKVPQLFKIKKYLISFHLSFIQRISASSEAFFYNCKKRLLFDALLCACAHARWL